MTYPELERYCHAIYDIVGKDTVVNTRMSTEVIRDYYQKSSFLYRNFHSKEGAMHLPIKFSDKESHKEKLTYQATSIHTIINQFNYINILELGCGMGFNTNFLAARNPDKRFTGIDLEPTNIKFAQQKSKKASNVFFHQMDYDRLEESGKKYDLIFVIETLCHSKDLIRLLNKLSNRLNYNGRIIIFDGYVTPEAPALQEFENHAYTLLSWGFALDGFQKLDDATGSNVLNGLEVVQVENLSENVLSNLTAFQKGATNALQYPRLLKILLKTRIIPLAFLKQISAGLFTPYFLKSGYLGYYKLELRKSGFH